MPKATSHHPTVYPMRIQARAGSLVEQRYYASSRLLFSFILPPGVILKLGPDAPGVTTNRDASLIIRNAEAAQYWQTIFLHDWAHMAAQHAGD
jgi:hypothetical protein